MEGESIEEFVTMFVVSKNLLWLRKKNNVTIRLRNNTHSSNIIKMSISKKYKIKYIYIYKMYALYI